MDTKCWTDATPIILSFLRIERTHRCRHCPYTNNGELADPAMIEMKKNVPVIVSVRDIVEERMVALRDLLKDDHSSTTTGTAQLAATVVGG